MADPSVPARPAPYTGGLDDNSGESQSPERPVFIQNPPRIDARGWVRELVTYLTGRKDGEYGATPVTKPAGDRTAIQRTDVDLQSGPAPVGITRMVARKIHGLVGPANSRGGADSLPYTGSWAYIPHQNINRRDAGKAVPALRTMDDHAHIPAVFAGNPPQG